MIASKVKRPGALFGKLGRVTHAVIYTRFSPRRNANESESSRTQEAQCRGFAEAKGWAVRSVHSDEAVSGKEVHKPALEEALASLKKGDVLLVYHRDRIARNLYLAELVHRRVRSAGARLVATTGDVAGDGDDPETVLVRQIIDAVAEYYWKLNAAKTAAAMLAQQKAGKRVGRYAPYGHQVDPDDETRLVPLPAEQIAIARVLELTAEGKSPYQVASALDEEMPGACRGKNWIPRTVAKIVKRQKA